jgi:UDP-glucose 4-epimerase
MPNRVLVTGATGKVGRTFIAAFLADRRFAGWTVRALTHNRDAPAHRRIEPVKGSIADRAVVERAMRGVTHVVHLATCKEIPEDVMDVTVKGLFWLLETARMTRGFKRFVLIGGDAGMGHFVYPHPAPVTETQGWTAYPGCYALSKVLEECMLGQYYVQYGLDGCCLRAPWIMEKDDFRFSQSWGDDVFGGPRWRDLVGPRKAAAYARRNASPVLCDRDGVAIKRGIVHVDDLVAAMLIALQHPKARQQTFNIAMDEPVDYRVVTDHLRRTRGMPAVDEETPYHSTWLDNAKARLLLGWKPEVDQIALVERAYAYRRAARDPRTIHYPG